MAVLIKNQIIKRLSKFVKNLSSNQINLSTFKGEGELSSINLDEKALEETIELPTWLKIQKATCGRLFIKIPWTNLKTLPIQIQLDDVLIEIETCEKLRDFHATTSANDPLIGKYGFTNRVIDGVSLSITNLTFAIKAQYFKASVFLPSLDICSVAPNGKRVDKLTATRISSPKKDHILLFKEISWPNARIEASSNENDLPGTAIRLIANSCRVHIAMKKSQQDSTMIASRLMIHFDDLLTVVNDAQLTSALNTYQEITQLMKQATDQKKQSVGEKLNKGEGQAQPSSFQPKAPTAGINGSIPIVKTESPPNDPFARYDLIETSLHFNIKRMDLHIVADASDRLVDTGSVQLTLANLSIDHYPYHESGSSKRHWLKYNESQSSNRNEWIHCLHEQWKEQFNLAKAAVPVDEETMRFEKALRDNRIRLFESCSVLSIDDFVFYPVSLNNDKQQKRRRPLLTSDKGYYQLPDSLGIINIQHTEYYYPAPYAFPVPNSDLYLQIMPLVIRVDFSTFSWLDGFVSTLSTTIDNSGVLKSNEPSSDLEHVDIKIEAMLPRIVISSETFRRSVKDPSTEQQWEMLEFNVSKVILTNTRTDSHSDQKKLEEHLSIYENNSFFHQTQWPFSKSSAGHISSLFAKHRYDTYLYDNPLSTKTGTFPEAKSTSRSLHNYYTMTTDSLKKSAKYDIWHIHASGIYLDFTPMSPSETVRYAKQNLTDALAFTGWAVLEETGTKTAVNLLGILESPSLIKISQKQFTFVMHLVDELGIFLDALDRNKAQTRLMKEQSSSDKTPEKEMKMTICLTIPTSFTLAVLDGFEDELLPLSTPPAPSLPEATVEPDLRDTSDIKIVVDSPPKPVPVETNPIKIEPAIPLKTPKKSKNEETRQRGWVIFSKNSSRGSSQSSLMNMSDNSDDTLSQLDITEDLDGDLDASLFLQDSGDGQQKITRLETDEDDSLSLMGKHFMAISPSESTNGVFLKLNQINVCITEDEEKSNQPMYIACNVKYLRIDEFSSMRFDAIKPKLFENERPDEFNNDDVPPIAIRVDFAKGQSPSPPPHVTVQMQNRTLATNSHTLEILAQNLEEIFTDEEKIARQNQTPNSPPIDINLNNVQITLEFPQEFLPTQTLAQTKPPVKMNIECLHVFRQSDGRVIIRDNRQQQASSNSSDASEKHLQELEVLRNENARLRAQVDAQKKEIIIVSGERDGLMQVVSKLDADLTEAESKRQQQQQQQLTPRKK